MIGGSNPPPSPRRVSTGRPAARHEPTTVDRPTSEAGGASKRFGSALDKLERQTGAERDGAAKPARPSGEVGGARPLTRKGAFEERGEGGQAAAPAQAHAASRPAEIATAPVDVPVRAEIERMAAAIAESTGDLRVQQAIVTLPPGGVAEGAVVSRDATGALSVRLSGFDPRLGALAADALRRDLATALRARRLTVRDIQLDTAPRDRPLQASR